MACFFPVGTYDGNGLATYRPCGMCKGCRIDASKNWAVRCYHEAMLHEENCFITLTYNDENLPEKKSVSKKEMSKFMKKLRKEIYPQKVRFFGAGEYGETNRPHYHLLLFGYNFDDRYIFRTAQRSIFTRNGIDKHRKTKGNSDLYRSETLEKIWNKGFSTIGEANYESAAYVARYVCKKIIQTPQSKKLEGDKIKEHYGDRETEFALMSRMPGIGKEWLERYLRDVYPKDFVTIKGRKYRPPRYYDEYLKKCKPKEMIEIKKKRRESASDADPETTFRQRDKEFHLNQVTKKLERELD